MQAQTQTQAAPQRTAVKPDVLMVGIHGEYYSILFVIVGGCAFMKEIRAKLEIV